MPPSVNVIFNELPGRTSQNLQLLCTWGQRGTDEILSSKVKDRGHGDRAHGQKTNSGPFCHPRVLNGASMDWFGCVIGGSATLSKMKSEGQRSRSQPKQIW